MSKIPEIIDLMKAGVHFGHSKSKWHPKMKPYIFMEKKGIHIINLEETAKQLAVAIEFLKGVVAKGGVVLFLGTKTQAQAIVKEAAISCGMPYIVSRWLGGTLTNAASILNLVKKYRKLKSSKETGGLEAYTKKEQLNISREIERLDEVIGGISVLDRIPDALFVVDIREEKTAITEAQKRNVPIVALCDTNVNPEKVQYPIAANDDAMNSIRIIVETVAAALKEVKATSTTAVDSGLEKAAEAKK